MGDYVLVSDGTYHDHGITVPKGMVVNRILYDGVAEYAPATGLFLEVDDGKRVYWVPPPLPEKGDPVDSVIVGLKALAQAGKIAATPADIDAAFAGVPRDAEAAVADAAMLK